MLTPGGHEVLAMAPGRVVAARVGNGFGNLVAVSHGQVKEGPYKGSYVSSLSAHHGSNLVQKGDLVTEGQSIAISGNTSGIPGKKYGFHTHHEFRVTET